MKTFKITFEGRYKDQLPITERLTQWVPAANPAAAVLALYDAFDVLVVHDIDEVTEFKTAEYQRGYAQRGYRRRARPAPRSRLTS